MALSHPWFTLIFYVLCAWFIYMFCKMIIDIHERLRKLRSALDGLVRISACRCNKAGTCAYCNASKVLEKEFKIAYETEESAG
jgi:hypothetical protein